jgi:hypothetical protein
MATSNKFTPGMEPLLKGIANAKGCDAKTLAVIAARFVAGGDDEQEALRKANALYLKATAYAKRFASLSADEKAFEVDPDRALPEAAERVDLAIGDSEANSRALLHFREIATTKTERNITHSRFVKLIEREFGRLPESIASSRLEVLHSCIRAARSLARSARRKKSVK